MASGLMPAKDAHMSPRTFGLLMLLFCSAMAGAGYARLSAAPPVAVADVAAMQPDTPSGQGATVQTNAGPDTRTLRSEPPVRVILPSPYEIRTN
jgi:hypothetical protein